MKRIICSWSLFICLATACSDENNGDDNNGTDPLDNFTFVTNYNGHSYYISKTAKNWNDAKLACEQAGGYLATITSSAENDIVFSCAQSIGQSPYIGLSDKTTEGTFQWVTGETLTYTNWLAGEPNNQGGTQDVVYMKASGDAADKKWDDGNETNLQYFVLEVP